MNGRIGIDLSGGDKPYEIERGFQMAKAAGMDVVGYKSLDEALKALKNGEIHGLAAAGDTQKVSTKLLRSRLNYAKLPRPGGNPEKRKAINLPAIIVFPDAKGRKIALADMGAHTGADGFDLAIYGFLLARFCQIYLGRESPSLGFLGVGEEEHKLHENDRLAIAYLKQIGLNYRQFCEGPIEPKQIIRGGEVDGVVARGREGNIFIKTVETTFGLAFDELKAMCRESLRGMAKGAVAKLAVRRELKALQERFRPSKFSGALIAGLKETVVILHGSSNAEMVLGGLEVCRSYVGADIAGQLYGAVMDLPQLKPPAVATVAEPLE